MAVALACALSVCARNGSAQEASTVAEGLFRDGIALLAKGEIDAACRKLAASEKLDPSTGTALNLGDCREKQGRTATAWEQFLEAGRLARKQGRPAAEREAKRRAGLLEPRLSYLSVVLAAKVPGTTIELDSVKLDAAALGSRLPVDPGEHTVTARAPGYESVSLHVTIGTPHDQKTLHVPALRRKAAGTAAAQPHPATKDRGARSGSRPPVLAYAIGGAGVAALATGAVFGLLARSAYSDAESKCPSRVGCSADALDRRHTAEVRANVANVGIGLGLAGVTAGVVLLLIHHRSPPSERSARLVIAPAFTRSRGGFAVQGGF